ncbi:NirD/YgiW/YdeI family stress tolerance protein [Vibrio sp. SCSIO 43135]|uniref:NirD/YgiW/YdeI family stress tolerance protein n=1 Tax=Vibrio paucivorans TaxID=2829489 RepID=A0A9X3CIR0_9VIBR|nr:MULTISPECIES: NirD/YgiW/YdeI family stress tolerance protein [Vibrio]MCW8335540.1 NirD/YgiW/YdeI family stress tolerance protein [Vibrio paucivorans]USD44039.1 NirD/YgiW/YdeI family stress tolerance protein [Vibrio sp. SCSIO 43135]
MKKTIIATAAALVLLPTLALAGNDNHKQESVIKFNGPVDVVTVQSLLEDTSMFTERDVVVEGTLVRQVRKDTFIFSDGQAEIQVELDDDIHLDTALDTTTKLRLFGEYEGGNTPEIEVDHIQVM